jgi:hypothetical protein
MRVGLLGSTAAAMTRRRWAATSLLTVAAGLLPAPAVQAHPFGDPQTAVVSATPDGVRVVWNATPDDLAVLAGWIGAADGSGSIMVFEDGEFAPEESTTLPGVQLARAPQLADYLLERITVSAAGASCAGALLPVEDVETTGATLDFDCGGPVGSAEIRVATLTDIDPAYRTLATGPSGQRHPYAEATGAIGWTLPTNAATAPASPAGDRARSAVVQLGGVGFGVTLLAGLGLVLASRRRTRRGPPEL